MLVKSVLIAILSFALYAGGLILVTQFNDGAGDSGIPPIDSFLQVFLLFGLPVIAVCAVVLWILNGILWSQRVSWLKYAIYCLGMTVLAFAAYAIYDYQQRAGYMNEAGVGEILKEYAVYLPLAVLLFALNGWWVWRNWVVDKP